jgi:hypothetical protein
MPRRCTVCAHGARVDIDRAILRGDSARAIAARFGVGEKAVRAHGANHVTRAAVALTAPGPAPPSMVEQARALDLRAEVFWCVDQAKAIFAKAETAADLPSALRAIREVRGVLALLGKYAELARGAEAATRAVDVRGKNWLEHFQTPRDALAWLESEGIPALRAAAAEEEGSPLPGE